ncbi:MAG: HNH endonuclease [Chloroflexota bacterium]|nr:HNH endonuclease [Chloroflexota bacterium]
MRDEILTYWEMCAREKGSLQRGMYFRQPPAVSVVLMSRRRGAPYEDSLSEDGTVLIYEGHDVKREPGMDPKSVDQPWALPSGEPTENARFARAAGAVGANRTLVRVYEKLRSGIWSDKGLFELVGYEYGDVGRRKVFKFRMRLSDAPDEIVQWGEVEEFKRVIPAWVKQAVYKRDKGRCVLCGTQDQLHFDHELPFSKGGTGLAPENVRILCARHNLQKGAKIE